MDKDYMLNYENTFKDFEEGEIIEGTIINIKDDYVFVDIGYKSEGIVPLNEFKSECNIGDKIKVMFLGKQDLNGFQILSKAKADRILGFNAINQAFKEGKPVKGIIKASIKGGFLVDVDSFVAFLPGSLVDLSKKRNFDYYIGKEYEFKVINIDEQKKNVILSRKQLLEEIADKKRSDLIDKIKVGDIVTGKVKNIVDYGVFVDLGGVDGFVHITDISWKKILNPREVLKPQDEIKAKVMRIEEKDDKKRIFLSIKHLSADPWEETKIKEGDIVEGKISNIVDYGVFIELEEGIEGLVHNSEISWVKFPKEAKEELSIGQTIKAKVLMVDTLKKKIALSIKRLEPEPWSDIKEKFHVGDVVEGVITGIKDFGVFVKIDEGIEGLIHTNELSWSPEERPSLTISQKIKAKIIDINLEKKKIALSLRQLEPDPWSLIEGKYKVGDVIEGVVTGVKDFGVFVKIEKGVESLIPKSELNNITVNKDEKVKIKIIRLEIPRRKMISRLM
ncbi:MAG: S1 RNA-binding domain-containing protein [Desulfurella sp.]|uniref:S1 RNA-binding domain-containing protein n=1 Tax=Desulfurella sp. TaxID=1962857 RepID=UPI003D1488B6